MREFETAAEISVIAFKCYRLCICGKFCVGERVAAANYHSTANVCNTANRFGKACNRLFFCSAVKSIIAAYGNVDCGSVCLLYPCRTSGTSKVIFFAVKVPNIVFCNMVVAIRSFAVLGYILNNCIAISTVPNIFCKVNTVCNRDFSPLAVFMCAICRGTAFVAYTVYKIMCFGECNVATVANIIMLLRTC